MATHSRILAWRIPWTEEPGGLQSVGLQRVGLDWVTNTFTLYMEMTLDKKQIWVIFLFEFKMGQKASEMTHNVSNASGSETANKYTVQWWFKKFCKETRALKTEECSGQPSEVDNDQLRASLKLILLQLPEKLPKNSVMTIVWFLSIWSKLKRWKSLVSGCLMSWPKI